MNKAVSAVLILATLAIIALYAHRPDNQAVVCFKSSCVRVELAADEPSRARGLMNRQALGQDDGMLFVFDTEGIYPFWMKNTLIPLDMIWMDTKGRVVNIEHAQPCMMDPCPDYNPMRKAKYVLEVNGRYTITHEVNIGDESDIRIPK
jgi:uncharacterized membrane protein (UPF0127 family)